MTTVIVKPTSRCNARCRYCAAAHERKAKSMSPGLLRPLFELFRSWVEKTGGSKLCFIWHGGEPLLMPDGFWKEVLKAQEEVFGGGAVSVVNRIQTNLTLLTPRRLPVLKQLLGQEGAVGTSVELLPGIRELAGAPQGLYARRLSEAIELLRKAGIRFGLIYVVHRLSLPKLPWIYRELRRMYPEAGLRFNALYREGRARREATWEDLGITAEQWGEALLALYRAWRSDGSPRNVQPFGPWQELYDTGRFRLSCECSGRCAADHFGVDPEGNVYLCGRAADARIFRFGRLGEIGSEDLLNDPLRRSLLNRKRYLQLGHCAGCPWWSFCHGGCPTEAATNSGGITSPTSFCRGLKNFFQEVFPPGSRRQAEQEKQSSKPKNKAVPIPCTKDSKFQDLKGKVLQIVRSGLAVSIEGLGALETQQAKRLVRFFLHDPALTRPLEPLSSLLRAMVFRRNLSLWELKRNEADVSVSSARQKEHSQCLSCAYFTHCAGWAEANGSCAVWKEIFAELSRAARQLRARRRGRSAGTFPDQAARQTTRPPCSC